jgi:signal transduction histidine kinase
MRLLPRTIAGRTILLLVLGLTLSHAVSMVFYASDRTDLLAATGGREFAHRAATAVEMLQAVPRDLRPRVIEAADAPDIRVVLAEESALIRDVEPDWRARLIRDLLQEELPSDQYDSLIVQVIEQDGEILARAAARLPDGAWVMLSGVLPHTDLSPSSGGTLSMLVMLVAVVVLSVLVVRRMTQPLRLLAEAAERLGRDVKAPPLPEQGPEEVRQASHAFNVMQARLRRFVEDRTQMLAAISHDLRTPITLLRLRAEFIEDEEERAKTLATLEEMEAMIAATLSFARDDAVQEDVVEMDVGALVQSLCDDLADAGEPVTCAEPPRAAMPVRATALRRAVGNLLVNALRYGERADVRVEASDRLVRVIVEDRGPGLPEAEREAVFRPFYRVERSRNRDTGGVGLGLSVVRSVAHLHGGEITLENRPEGGLRAVLSLPRVPAA